VKIITVLGAIAVAVVFFFAVIFALAASVQATLTRLATSAILFIIGITIITGIYYTTRKPKTIIQHLQLSGKMAATPIKCPNCSASINPNHIKIVQGVPYATCPYCGNTFEVTEEPKW
jgi:DNA-directed RNA polymerase subunit RPC12/RpoP